MPYPTRGEDKEAFIGRCMNSKHAKEKYPDTDQRAAVCYSLWDTSKKKKK